MTQTEELKNTQDLVVIDEKRAAIAQHFIIEADFACAPKIKLTKSQKKELRKSTRRKRAWLEAEVRERAKKSLLRNYKYIKGSKFFQGFVPPSHYS